MPFFKVYMPTILAQGFRSQGGVRVCGLVLGRTQDHGFQRGLIALFPDKPFPVSAKFLMVSPFIRIRISVDHELVNCSLKVT